MLTMAPVYNERGRQLSGLTCDIATGHDVAILNYAFGGIFGNVVNGSSKVAILL